MDQKNLLIKFSHYAGVIFLLISFYLLVQTTSPDRLSFKLNSLDNQKNADYAVYPKLLKVKDLGINLSVYPAHLDKGNWQATSKGISYLDTSAFPGSPGNSIFYGHNWPNLLGGLNKAVPGQEIEITFSDGVAKKFEIAFTQVVTPDQTYILNQTQDNRLTLYTCTGFLDRQRFVVTAIPKA